MPTSTLLLPARRSAAKTRNPRLGLSLRARDAVRVVERIRVRCSPQALYAFWQEPTNLVQLIDHPVRITRNGPKDSHWEVGGPAGKRMEWDATIIKEVPNRSIAWRTRAGADVKHAGTVRFLAAPRGGTTLVEIKVEYDPPGGKFGAFLARITRTSAGLQIRSALKRLKTLADRGELEAAGA